MEISAKLRHARFSAQKGRLVANQIRGMHVDKAINTLQFSNKKAAAVVKKVLMSAIANAENNEGADIDELRISQITVDEGPVMKRFRARAKGRGTRILKRTSHIKVTVSDDVD